MPSPQKPERVRSGSSTNFLDFSKRNTDLSGAIPRQGPAARQGPPRGQVTTMRTASRCVETDRLLAWLAEVLKTSEAVHVDLTIADEPFGRLSAQIMSEATREFEALDGSLKKVVAKQIDKLAERPELGEPLGKRMGIDLSGYRKIYFGKKGYRIVYEIQRHKLVILIIGIGKRERAEMYREVAQRLRRSD